MATEFANTQQGQQQNGIPATGLDVVKIMSGLTNTGLGLFLVGWLMTAAVPKLESAHFAIMSEVKDLRAAIMQQANAYDKLTMEIRESRLSREREKRAFPSG